MQKETLDAQYRCTCGIEELVHMEIISAIIHQLTKDLTPEEIAASGFDKYYVDYTLGLWPQAAAKGSASVCAR